MIVCTECGQHNATDDDFCGGCGEFLEWTGEAVEDEQQPPSEPGPTREEAAEESDVDSGLVRRVRDLVGLDQQEAETVAASPEVAEAVATTDDGTPAGDDERATAEEADAATTVRAEAAERAAQEARAAEDARQEAEQRLEEEAEAAERARGEAEAADRARAEAERRAAEKEAELERLREQLAATEEDREAAEENRERAEEAERQRAVAQARADEEAAKAEQLKQQADEAERARREAEQRAKEEDEAAARARRAAALVAKPSPDAETQAGAETERDTAGPGARPPTDAAAPADAETEVSADDAGPGPQQPGPVKPATPEQKPVRQKAEQSSKRRYRPGDLICGRCGEGNDPGRNFCRRCGNDLAGAEEAPEPGVWERIKGMFRREPERYEAGERPMRAGGSGGGGEGVAAKGRAARRKVLGTWATVMKALMVIGALGLTVGITISPLRSDVTSWIGDRVDSVMSIVNPTFEPVNAVGAQATSATAEHPAGHAVDLLKNTWWQTEPGAGEGAQLFVEFGDPVDIAKVGFLNGAASEEEFVAQPRPREVHLVFSNGVTADVTLSDSREFQVFDVEGAEQVTDVELQILSLYQGQSGQALSLTEVEFRTRQ